MIEKNVHLILNRMFLEPVGFQRHNVPHFKGLIMFYLDFGAQGRGSTFTFCLTYLKKAILWSAV